MRPSAARASERATAGGRTSGSSTSVTSASRPRNLRASTTAAGVPSARISACAANVVFRLTSSASVTTGFPSCETSLAGLTRAKTAITGSARNASATKPTSTSPPTRAFRFTCGRGSPPPAASTAPRAAAASRRSTARPARCLLDFTICDGVLDDRLRAPADADGRHLAAHAARIGRVDEPRVGLAERDLREHLADVALVADDVPQRVVEREVVQHDARVVADRDAGRGDDAPRRSGAGRRPSGSSPGSTSGRSE